MLIISFLTLDVSNDKYYAQQICNGNKEYLSDFIDLYTDELYYISSKFINKGINEDYWEYRTKKGYTIRVNDEVSDTFCWLFKIAKNKSCLYRGDKGASFKTYIISVLNSRYTFNDWLKWKTGITGYVPKCIKQLGDQYKETFLLLKQRKSQEHIINKLGLTKSDFAIRYHDIESALIETNQIDLIKDINIISIDSDANESSSDSISELKDNDIEIMTIPDSQYLLGILKEIIELLSDAERRIIILYWGENLSVEQIYTILSQSIFKEYLEELSIVKSSDIYKSINNIVTKFFNNCQEKNPELIVDFNLNQKVIRRILKVYMQNFYI